MSVKVEKGSHLTVTIHENGFRELQWDDEALLKDVKEAIANFESGSVKKPSTKKRATKKKAKAT